MATIIMWSKEPPMQAKNDGDLHGGQRSSEVKCGKLCAMATIFGQKNRWCKLRMMVTFMEVKGHQGSNVVFYVLWLPYLVNRPTDALRSNTLQPRFTTSFPITPRVVREPASCSWYGMFSSFFNELWLLVQWIRLKTCRIPYENACRIGVRKCLSKMWSTPAVRLPKFM